MIISGASFSQQILELVLFAAEHFKVFLKLSNLFLLMTHGCLTGQQVLANDSGSLSKGRGVVGSRLDLLD